jgi:methyl-accepting chemotaxis protein
MSEPKATGVVAENLKKRARKAKPKGRADKRREPKATETSSGDETALDASTDESAASALNCARPEEAAEQAELASTPDTPEASSDKSLKPVDDQAARREHESSAKSGQSSNRGSSFYEKYKFPSWVQVPRINVRDNVARTIFISVLIGGVFTIGIGKLSGLLSATFAAIVATACILGYSLAAYLIREERVRLDRAGDNAYYLGLTFTLVSMAVALLQIDFSGVTANQLVGAFGIALSSTIVGIVCRLALIQYREEIDDIEAVARQELADSAAELSRYLLMARGHFEVFVTGLQTQMSDSVETIIGEHLQTQKLLAEEVNKTLVTAAEKISTSAEAIQRAMEKQTATVELFHAASVNSSEAAAELAKKITEIEVPKDAVQEIFKGIKSEMHEAALGLAEAASRLNSSIDNAGVASEAMKGLSEHSLQASEKMAQTVEKVGTLVGALDEFTENLGRQKDGMSTTVQTIAEEIKSLQQMNNDYIGALSETASFLAKEIRKDAGS